MNVRAAHEPRQARSTSVLFSFSVQKGSGRPEPRPQIEGSLPRFDANTDVAPHVHVQVLTV